MENLLKLISRVFDIHYGMTSSLSKTNQALVVLRNFFCSCLTPLLIEFKESKLKAAELLALVPVVHATSLELLDKLIVK